MWYPKDGYIAWHNNWNVPGYNVLFTYTETGNGYWRHINPAGSKGKINKPFDKHLVHLQQRLYKNICRCVHKNMEQRL